MANIGKRVSLGYQQIVNPTVATALNVPDNTQQALIDIEAATVRWRDDGVDPTASVGKNLAIGASLSYTSASISKLKFIGAGATINIIYYSATTD